MRCEKIFEKKEELNRIVSAALNESLKTSTPTINSKEHNVNDRIFQIIINDSNSRVSNTC